MFKKIIHKFLLFFNYSLRNNNLDYFPIEKNNFEKKIIKNALNYSMTNPVRMSCLLDAFKYVVKNKIKGDFVECGVWKGGNLILLQNLIEKYSVIGRKIYAYDTFSGMSKFGKIDYNNNSVHASVLLKENKDTLCYSSLEDVKSNFYSNTKFNKNLITIVGRVEDTLKKKLPKKISILRLDTDYYSSTKIELEKLWPRLTKGGILIIDDYGYWKGCRKAVDEFFYKKYPFLIHIDETCRLIIKK
jgi:O-methyltransferase